MKDAMKRAWRIWGGAVDRWLAVLARGEPAYAVAGPLFEKDLRVSSRRARTYIIRFIYMGALAGFVAMVWLSTVTVPSAFRSEAYYAYAMPEAGRAIISTVVWFQFIVLQALALVMLSTSISDEIYSRTLGVLMTTPITSVHIVLGKLLGKLFQVVLLAALSLPILLLVQTLGGVSWEFVVASLTVTLTTVLLVGSLSLYASISSRRSPLMAILKTVAAMSFLFIIVPVAWYELGEDYFEMRGAETVVLGSHPYLVLAKLTMDLYSPQAVGGPPVPAWWWHAGGSAAFSVLVLALATVRVRHAARKQLLGEGGGFWRRLRRGRPGRIRRVRGSPVIWKELRSSVVGSRFVGFVTWLAAAGVLGLIYALTWQDVLRYSEGHTVFAVVLMALSLGVTAIITPTGIAREREAGTWPLLLATPLEASQIVAGKAVALVRRSLPVWSLLGLHLVLFTCLGRIHPAALAHVGILAASMLVLLTGSGLFWSTCVRKATWAVILNLAFCAAIWFVLPMFLSMGSGMFLIMAGSRSHGMFLQSLVMALYMVHPLVQVGMTVNGAAGQAAAGRALWALKYDWASGDLGVTEYTLIVVVVALVYIALGLLMARAASRRLRKNAF